MEYVIVHAGKRGKTFQYELIYRGEAERHEPFAMGLIDIATLKEETTIPSSRDKTTTSRGHSGHIAVGSRHNNHEKRV